MDIYFDEHVKHMSFGDLQCGDVFCFVKDLVNVFASHDKVYMKVERTSTDKGAVNLSCGIIYSFNDDEPVVKYAATLKLANFKGGYNGINGQK